jgi:hypothetical protein
MVREVLVAMRDGPLYKTGMQYQFEQISLGTSNGSLIPLL